MTTTLITKPANEVVIRFGKDRNDCIIVIVFDVHGTEMQEMIKAAGFDTMKLLGREAIKRSAEIIKMMERQGFERKAFVAKGLTYLSYTSPFLS